MSVYVWSQFFVGKIDQIYQIGFLSSERVWIDMVELHLSDNLPILLSGFTGLTLGNSDIYTLLKLLGTKSLYH